MNRRAVQREMIVALVEAHQAGDTARADQILRTLEPDDRMALVKKTAPPLRVWLLRLKSVLSPQATPTIRSEMSREERDTLTEIVCEAHRLGGRAHVLGLLRGISWVSPEAKTTFWEGLPLEVRNWLTAKTPPPVPDRPGLAEELSQVWNLSPTVRAIARGVVSAAEGASDEELGKRLKDVGIDCPLALIPAFSAWLRETG